MTADRRAFRFQAADLQPLLPALADLRPELVPHGAWIALHLETEHYFLELRLASLSALVTTFERAGRPDPRPDRYREGWGVVPFVRLGASVLAVKPKRVDWYLQTDLGAAFDRLRPLLFHRFAQRVAYGTSMGAFGALTYGDALAATRVVALAPQSTVNPAIMPEERRFPQARGLDWTCPAGDAAGRSARVGRVFLVYDPMEPRDQRHVDRLMAPNVELVKLSFAGHEVPVVLRDAGALDLMVNLCLTGRLDRAALGRALRSRRSTPAHLDRLARAAQGRPAFLALIAAARSRAAPPPPLSAPPPA